LYKVLKHSGIQCEKRNLDLGDIMWIARTSTGLNMKEIVLNYIIERKKVEDLIASIEDGRYKEQKFRLKKSGLQNLIYLIEGHIDLHRNHLFETEMAATQIEDGFFIAKTVNEEDTIAYLVNMTLHFGKLNKKKIFREPYYSIYF